ncbi:MULTISPECIES: UDP-glucose 4-epimerase GalE [unclassified Lentilitoribacter]|uniref:UDP-glucose 4-epimerase GalE n=1 Tax=unclassified Lentilitoribacter TaxID=2647570 RepID=UPI0013A6ED8A|nr:UDP-glucose 4-epimerase GalE [Lentilitoribacter sp. Alg239-R112]
MTVLVTGGAGYIGSHMVWALLDRGEEPVVVDRLSNGIRSSIPQDIPFYQVDIADKDAMAKIMSEHNVDAIIHFAGSISVAESIKNPLEYYRNNTTNSQNLIEVALDQGIEHMVFSSTAAVYGTPLKTDPVIEETPLHPQSPYGHSKMMTERILTSTSTAHDSFNFAALRYFNVGGADPQSRTGQTTQGALSLIKVACETATGKRDHIQVYGTDYDTPDGTCIRDFIHVSDLVQAHLSALDQLRGRSKSMIANCGYGKGFSVLDVLKMVSEVAGKEINVQTASRRAGDIVSITANNNRIKTLTDWQEQHDDLSQIIRSAYEWEQGLANAS